MAYSFKMEKFEGPLELLLDLIEKQKMEITEVSLSKVADEYLEFVRSDGNIQLGSLADFLTVASKLILIKSRALIPILEFSEEEEEEIKDLAKQLEEFKKFKEASEKLGKMGERGAVSYSREGFLGIEKLFYPPENFNKFDFKKYFLGVLSEIPVVEKLEEEMVREVITLEEKINSLQETLRRKIEVSFSELASGSGDRVEIIVSFLAMLEMVKQKLIDVEQGELFEEIRLKIKS